VLSSTAGGKGGGVASAREVFSIIFKPQCTLNSDERMLTRDFSVME
jgi:hypothetical protein